MNMECLLSLPFSLHKCLNCPHNITVIEDEQCYQPSFLCASSHFLRLQPSALSGAQLKPTGFGDLSLYLDQF